MGLNQFSCLDAFGNTGISKCSLIPKHMVGLFIVPLSFVITPANAQTPATLQAFLEAAAQSPVKSERIFPVHNFEGFTDNSEDTVTETTGYGTPIPLRDGNYSWQFRFIQGGLCLLKQLQKFNGQSVAVLLYDADGVLYGYSTTAGLKGVPLAAFFAPKWTGTDSTTVANFLLTISMAARYLNKFLGFYKNDDFNPGEIIGLQDVNIEPTGTQTVTVLNVLALAGCGGENIYELFSTELASGPLWEVRNAATGALLTITSVVANPATQGFTITLSAARPGAVTVNLAPVDDLSGAGITGFEGAQAYIPAAS